MQTANVEIMRSARESLRGKWRIAITVTVTYVVLLGAIQSIRNIGQIASLLVSGPLAGGFAMFALAVARNHEAKFELLFDGFKSYVKYLGAYLLIMVYVLLWALLLIIPGILAALSYSMTYYVIADDPTIGVADALRRSKELMRGNRGKYFGLMLRFIGWVFLSILTLGIGLLWLIPYMQVTAAKFYDDLKNSASATSAAGEPVDPAVSAPQAPAPFVDEAPGETVEAKPESNPFITPDEEVRPTQESDGSDTPANA